MSDHSYILAHDLGTTGNKATLIDATTGVASASAYEAYDTAYPRPNWAEQDMVDFLGQHQHQGPVLSRHPSTCALAQKQLSETVDIYEQVPYNFTHRAISRAYR